jgi:hypothetical protein
VSLLKDPVRRAAIERLVEARDVASVNPKSGWTADRCDLIRICRDFLPRCQMAQKPTRSTMRPAAYSRTSAEARKWRPCQSPRGK